MDNDAEYLKEYSMKSAREYLIELNATDEGEALEAKEISGSSIGKSFYETVSAFCNEPGLGGGVIVLGVSCEQDLFSTYRVTGIEDADKISTDIATTCQTKFNVPVRPRISVEQVDGKNVVLIEVKEANTHQKPVYIHSKGITAGAYRRIGSADVRCTDEDLYALFSHRSDAPVDSQILEEGDWSDFDAQAVQSYRSDRRAVHPSAEELNWSDEDLIFALRGAKKSGSTLKPTLAGLLLFGKTQSLRRLGPAHRVDYIRVPGRQWIQDADRRFESIEMRGPMISLVPRVISAILDDLPRAFSLPEGGTAQRDETTAVPETVIREAVVNALMHRSYSTHQPVQIIRYANRLEIRNPGHSLKSEEKFDEPGSLIRNPCIAEVLHETRFAENKGSGIRVMRAKMAEAGLTPPTFKSDRDADSFTAFLLFHHFLNDDDVRWISVFQSYNLTDEQLRALIFVREVGAIDNKSFRDLTGLDTLRASKALRGLRDHELLDGKGGGNQAYYAPSELLNDFIVLGAGSQGSAVALQGSSGGPKVANSITVEDLPPGLRKELTHLRLKKRKNRKDVEEFILAACSWSSLSTKEIADLLDNNPTYVQQNYLSKMIVKGLLYHTHPEMVNHPEQKYTSTV